MINTENLKFSSFYSPFHKLYGYWLKVSEFADKGELEVNYYKYTYTLLFNLLKFKQRKKISLRMKYRDCENFEIIFKQTRSGLI